MSHTGYILTAWIVPCLAIALYCVMLAKRGRKLTRSVDPSRRRWMQADVETRRAKR